MRKLFTVLTAVLLSATVFAQSPQKMSYQAVIRNSGNTLITSTNVGIRISILQGSATGTPVYVETQTPTTNANGLVSIEIGNGIGFDSINWANGPYFIKTETDPTGSTNYTITGTSQILSVPYALHAQVSDSGNYNNLINKPTIFDGTWTSLTGKPAFAIVATSGSYNDLTDKPTGTNPGDIQYWNGTTWIMIPVGQPGQYLQLTASNIPSWTGATYPVLTTTAASSITQSTATAGGDITTDGGSTVTARGVCWGTAANPTIANSITSDGTGTGSFSSSITGLTPNTIYYIRAYATNSIGTGYGNELSFTTADLVTIGQSYQGGIVAYILQPADAGYDANQQHGLIMAPSDQSTAAPWGCVGTAISGADGIAVGTGNQNTIDIVAGCTTAGIAAQLCSDLVLGIYSDWYLPSKDELNKLYLSEGILQLASQNYWCSSEFDANNGWKLNFGNGSWSSNSNKGTGRYVRAVRSF